jgi:hypothetical protein
LPREEKETPCFLSVYNNYFSVLPPGDLQVAAGRWQRCPQPEDDPHGFNPNLNPAPKSDSQAFHDGKKSCRGLMAHGSHGFSLSRSSTTVYSSNTSNSSQRIASGRTSPRWTWPPSRPRAKTPTRPGAKLKVQKKRKDQDMKIEVP